MVHHIGLYRDVCIAAIASSRTRFATLTGAMCKTSQYELRSLRVNSGMLNVIRIVTYYTLPPFSGLQWRFGDKVLSCCHLFADAPCISYCLQMGSKWVIY